MAENIIKYRNGFDRIPYTEDDQPMRSMMDDDEDGIHFDKVSGVDQELLNKLGKTVTGIRSDFFNITVLGEFQDVQKGYYAVVRRQWVNEEELPLYGVDTNYVEDLEQVRLIVSVFEPIHEAELLFTKSIDRSARRRAERSHRRIRRL